MLYKDNLLIRKFNINYELSLRSIEMANQMNLVTAAREHIEDLGDSLRQNLNRLGALAGAAILLAGCRSPSGQSYVNNAQIGVPMPPAEARITINISTDENDNLFINYISWDSASSKFVRKDVHYTATSSAVLSTYSNEFEQKGAYVQPIRDGEVLASGIIVDQEKGILLMPGGYTMDGKTGDILDKDGKIIKHLERN